MTSQPSKAPLKVSVNKDKLVISIGIDTLAHCAQHCPRLCNDETHDKYPYVLVDNPDWLADDIRDILVDENEAGASMLTILFDNAIEQAYEDGSHGFEEFNRNKN